VTRKDFQELAAIRLKEARILLRARCWEGAFHFAGLVIEYALKACIAKQTIRHEFPDKEHVIGSYTHNLRTLIRLAGLESSLQEAAGARPELSLNWSIVREWSEQSRYERPSPTDAENLVRAVGDRRYGVLRWLRQHW
jgi:HEPN domain-containing protein